MRFREYNLHYYKDDDFQDTIGKSIENGKTYVR
jgi:hypothetical protein